MWWSPDARQFQQSMVDDTALSVGSGHHRGLPSGCGHLPDLQPELQNHADSCLCGLAARSAPHSHAVEQLAGACIMQRTKPAGGLFDAAHIVLCPATLLADGLPLICVQVLAAGVILVTLNTSQPAVNSQGSKEDYDLMFGLGASALSGLSSAYAGVYFEK